jgi:hypothetical protein
MVVNGRHIGEWGVVCVGGGKIVKWGKYGMKDDIYYVQP